MYVSCNATTMANNVIDLCVPQGLDGNGGGVPFKPVKALAGDLFRYETRRSDFTPRTIDTLDSRRDCNAFFVFQSIILQ